MKAITLLFLSIALLWSLFFLNTLALNRIAVASRAIFNKDDFTIKDFGIGDDGKLFLTVMGQAGGTEPQKNDTGYAYVFVTDADTYAVSSDWMYPTWHTHEIILDGKYCIESMNMNVAGADITDTIKLTKTNATKLDKVMTAEFTLNNVNGSICATRIFDSVP